ncbi:hypothetical protein ACJIZ3_018079 [Penstemon smallii]|uniref:C2H2-type domain-containing protein n=1 Tax=Penstemon smallii TaxID=265156 RepID=A0ABD3SXB8_9LAMI
MDNLNQKKLAVSTGHGGHGVHLCLRCGWPYPNPHPSSRHRRAHKRVCGTIEGYEIYHSQSDNHQVVVSDDEHASDEDQHTPKPTAEKKAKEFGSSSGVGGKSNRSEDDVFSDAVTDFSDSGISPQQDKSMEQRTVDRDLGGSDSKKVDEADRTEPLNDPTSSDQVCTPGAPVNETEQSESVVFITDSRVEPIYEIPRDASIDSTNTLSDKEMQQGMMKAGQDEDVQGEEDKPISILDPEEGKTSGSAMVASERNEVQIEKPATEIMKIDPSLLSEGFEYIDATDSTPTKCSDVVSSVSFTEKESEQKINLGGVEDAGNSDLSNGEKCTGHKSHNQEPEDKFSGEIVSFAPEVDQNQKEFVNHSDEAEEERGQGAATGVHFGEVKSTDFSSSCEVDSEATHLEKIAKTEAYSLESLQELDKCMVTEVLLESEHDISDSLLLPVTPTDGTNNVKGVESVDAAAIAPDLKHNGDIAASEKNPKHAVSQDSAPSFTDSEVLKNTDTNVVAIELNDDASAEVLTECSESPYLEMQETILLNEKLVSEISPDCKEGHTNEDATTTSKPIDIAPGAEETCDSNAVTFTPISNEPLDSALDFHVPGENSVIVDNGGENIIIDSKCLQDESDVELKKKDSSITTAMNLLGSSISAYDCLEEKCGSVPDMSKTDLQEPKTTTEEDIPHKSDVFEPPVDQVYVASEIETVQNNIQQLNSGVVNEKKKEEAKVTDSSQVKHHIPLKNLLSEAKSPNTSQVPAAKEKDGAKPKDNGGDVNKEMEEWDSPARYPIEIKKEKKKGRPYWVPFVCCSSVHSDL